MNVPVFITAAITVTATQMETLLTVASVILTGLAFIKTEYQHDYLGLKEVPKAVALSKTTTVTSCQCLD